MPLAPNAALEELRERIVSLAGRPDRLRDFLNENLPRLRGPQVVDFAPMRGRPGTIVEIHGSNFSGTRADNQVSVGGAPALVVEASESRLRAITDDTARTGPVEVTVGGRTADGPHDFEVLDAPVPGSDTEGPPIHFAGTGTALAGDVPSTGTLNVLVALVNPSDRVPSNPANARTAVLNAWSNVHTFYDQASYGRLNVHVDVTASWHTLSGNFNDYVTVDPADSNAPNVRPGALDRLTAEAANAAQGEGLSLNSYAIMATVIFLNGTFIRAWGGWSRSNFSYVNAGAGININITADHEVNLLAIQETADWGRFAHETGHNIVSAPSALSASPGAATLGEDVYSSDLVDPSVATAQDFEIMGNHDTHPCFSAYHMEKLGYYGSSNVLDLQWDRNAFSHEYDVVAHGPSENSAGGRYHLLKIKVADGLYYYVEVRQRPGTTSQVFDPSIPLDGASNDGGVVVYKVLTDTVNNNQQLRFITLLHDAHVLKQGDVATDPARDFKITVVNGGVAARPLVSRVRVEWAQTQADDPNGAFDLRVEPWGAGWQTADIWVDRIPYGAYDQPLDAQGRPQGNGDKPRPLEINHFWGRVHCDGAMDASSVRVTFYAVDPPGVGDNGNWAPLQTKVVPAVTAGGYTDVNVNWVPQVGQHTCLKVYAERQLGEVTGGNNSAQENVFQFEAPAHSVPAPVTMPVAVRNPRKEPSLVLLGVHGVPDGYTVQFPHSWLQMEALEERRLELTVVPTLDYKRLKGRDRRPPHIRVAGDVPRSYEKEVPPGSLPGSRMLAIGGVTAQVTPKQGVRLRLGEDREHSKGRVIAVRGAMVPGLAGEWVRVDLTDPKGRLRPAEASTDGQGGFTATFDLTRPPSLDVKADRRRREKPVPGVYKARARTINSPNAAQADSNVVVIDRRDL
jgi:IPT/TIG domain